MFQFVRKHPRTCAAVSIYFNSSAFTDAVAVLLSLLMGCLMWSSPMVTDDISLQFMTVGVFCDEAKLMDGLSSCEKTLPTVLLKLSALSPRRILLLAFIIPDQWSVTIFIILDSFFVFKVCKRDPARLLSR